MTLRRYTGDDNFVCGPGGKDSKKGNDMQRDVSLVLLILLIRLLLLSVISGSLCRGHTLADRTTLRCQRQ
jgi:hypothetical protein